MNESRYKESQEPVGISRYWRTIGTIQDRVGRKARWTGHLFILVFIPGDPALVILVALQFFFARGLNVALWICGY